MKKKDSVAEGIRESLERVPGIQCAFIHGPFLKESKHSKSNIGITVVGGPDLAELDEILTRIEEEFARPVDATSFTVREFQQRMNAKEGLVTRILKEPRIMLIGGGFPW